MGPGSASIACCASVSAFSCTARLNLALARSIAKSVKTTYVGGIRGYDGAKKLVGRKRHILVDTEGLVHAANVHSASIMDCDGIKLVLDEATRAELPRMRLLWLDAGYNGRDKGKD